MSAHKHTPGPWDFVTGRTLHHIETAHGHQAAAGIPVCSVPKSRKADARLIAAAPELLEALEPFAHATLTHTGQVIGLMREDFERAIAAIAKATGEPA